MNPDSKIYVAGHRGLAGSAIVRALKARGYTNLLVRSHAELDLRDQQATKTFLAQERPEYVFDAAAKVGGIQANNTLRAEFIYDNVAIQSNLIHYSYEFGVKKLLFLGSSCVYPKLARQPLREEYLLTGPLEPTNEPYAIAKISGIKMCEAYRSQYGFDAISLMPTNLYGPGDNFDPESSHVMAALMRRFHEAKSGGSPSVTLWGTGTPRREFLYVDDLADAALFLMTNYSEPSPINVGVGDDLPIAELASEIKAIVRFEGGINYDSTKPDGTPRKLLDVSKLTGLGWRARTSLSGGLANTYSWYLANVAN